MLTRQYLAADEQQHERVVASRRERASSRARPRGTRRAAGWGSGVASTSPIAPRVYSNPPDARRASSVAVHAIAAPRGERARAASRIRCRGTRRSGGSCRCATPRGSRPRRDAPGEHEERDAPRRLEREQRDRRVRPGDEHEDHRVVESLQPRLDRGRPPMHVIRAARPEERTAGRPRRAAAATRAVTPFARRDEQRSGRDREHEGDLVQADRGSAV